MASDSNKNSSSSNNNVTREVESRQKSNPERIFEVFLEITDPSISKSQIIRKYPTDFNDEVLNTISNFAYPCKTTSEEQSENFTFSILDPTGTVFRYGYCRRSSRETSCLCLISYYTWFEMFYGILNDLFVLINGKSNDDVERFLSSLYNYRLMSNEEFFRNEGKETITISRSNKIYTYNRPDSRKLPSMLSSLNFTVMCTRLGPDILLHLFSHVLFERRILFVSSKLFHLTACVFGSLQMIYPMHWQSIFLPILPDSMSWTVQCTAPYIIGVHSSVFATLNPADLGDVVVVNIDERRLESQHDDLSFFPKYLLRNLKKGIEQSSRLAGDHLARVFLRTMAFSIGNYPSGFSLKNEKLDFDRDVYLEQFRDTHIHSYMIAIANTQMFEQFSRYRTYVQLERETEIDEFDLEVKTIEDIKKSKKGSKKMYKILEKFVKDGPSVNKNSVAQRSSRRDNFRRSLIDFNDERLTGKINKAGQRVANEASSMMNERMKRSHSAKPMQSITSEPPVIIEPIVADDLITNQKEESLSASSRASTPLIDLELEENLIQPAPIVLNVIHSVAPPQSPRSTPQIDPKIKQLQNELQHKVQTFDGKRVNPRDEYGQQQSDIRRLVKQFDPLCEDDELKTVHNSVSVQKSPNEFLATRLRQLNSTLTSVDRRPSIYENIPNNCVNNILQSIRANYGTDHRPLLKEDPPKLSTNNSSFNFDPLAPSTESKANTDGSNLIDFN